MTGGAATRVTNATAGASNPRWRPDGKAILFESPVRSGPPADKSTARAYDAMPIRFWNTWLDGSKPHVFVQEIGGLAVDWLAGTRLAAGRGFDGVYAGDGGDAESRSRLVARRPRASCSPRSPTATR